MGDGRKKKFDLGRDGVITCHVSEDAKRLLIEFAVEKEGLTKAGVNGPKYFLRETECLASCGTAPCLQINEDHHENLNKAKVDALLEKLS